MKVLHVVALMGRDAGGPARSIQGLVAALCKRGVDAWVWPLDNSDPWIPGVRKVEVIANPRTVAASATGADQRVGSPHSASFARGIRYHACRGDRDGTVEGYANASTLEQSNTTLATLLRKATFGRISRTIRTIEQFDIVHIHGIWSWGLHRVAAMCRKAGVPYIIAPRGMLEPWSLKQKGLKKRIARWLYQDRDLRLAAALHATAESEAEQFRKLGFKNKIIVAPNGVNVPEKKVEKKGGGGQRKDLAIKKVEEWLEGVDEVSFGVALDKLVVEKARAGEYLFEKQEDKEKAIAAAKAFFDEYSRKIVELSDGRCVYFAPDPRSKIRHADISSCWAEYAFHAVSSGGDKIPGKSYNYRKYSEYKVVNTDLIEDTLKSERCVPVLKDKPSLDSVKFFGSAHLGGRFDVVVRLDECGNANANMTEVTFEASTKRGQKKPPQLVSLAEAVRTVVSHQTATGTYPSDKNILPNHCSLRNGLHRALFVSRMHPKKGVLELVESWARVKKEVERKGGGGQWCVELVYTVSGEMEKAYEQKVKDRILALGMTYGEMVHGVLSVKSGKDSASPFPAGQSPDFIFTGALDDEKKWEAYARADLFVLPTYSENFGIVVAEALWAGVPVITTKGTPWSELEERKCGWWIDLPEAEVEVEGIGLGQRSRSRSRGEVGGEWEALDEALREATSTSDLDLDLLGQNGRALVTERYIWAAVCDKMLRGYEDVLG